MIFRSCNIIDIDIKLQRIKMQESNNSSFYVELPNQIEPFETPFESEGEADKKCKFIYMTNRYKDRYSGLLPIGFNMGWELTEYFPMGYMQVLYSPFVLEKR